MSGFPWLQMPAEVAQMPPGPDLAAALAGLDPRYLTGDGLEALLVAQQRQINALHAAQMATMLELGLRDIGPDDPETGPPRKDAPDQYSSDALRPPLVWTARMADTQFTLAWDIQTRIPDVHAAMCTGTLDQRRAAIFSDWTLCLSDDQARIVCVRVLPDAPTLTTGELRERLRRECIAIDPDWAARRYAEAVKERQLVKSTNPDGSANLSGRNLPLDDAAEAKATVDRLAKKAKAAGDPRRRAVIAADIYLGLLTTYRNLTDAQIVADLLLRAREDEDAAPTPDDDRDHDETDQGDTSPPPPHSSGSRSSAPRLPGPRTPGPRPPGPRPPGPRPAGPRPPGPRAPGPRAPGPRAPGPRAPGPRSSMARAVVRVGVDVRIELTTALGWDDRPAHVPGWDHVHAALGRRMVYAQTCGQWRFAITGEDGRLRSEGVTRARPAGWRDTVPPCHGGTVELAIPRTLLDELADRPGQAGAWASVITDIAAQANSLDPANDEPRDPGATPARAPMPTEEETNAPRRATPGHSGPTQRARAAQNAADGSARDTAGGPVRDAAGRDVRRFPRFGLRRFTQIRDRQCCAPGCRAPAMDCDADHMTRHTDGGATSAGNLQNLCRHDHALKDDGGWRAERLADGTVRWRTRHGTTHDVKPPPIITNLPTPRPHRGPPTTPSP